MCELHYVPANFLLNSIEAVCIETLKCRKSFQIEKHCNGKFCYHLNAENIVDLLTALYKRV